MRKMWCVVVATATLVSSTPARAETSVRDDWADFGFGVAAVAINTLYVPAKLLYAGFGGLFGSIALGVTAGNMKAADEIWGPTMGGDYVVTTDMLKGRDGLTFVGDQFGDDVQSEVPLREEGL